MSYLQRKFHEFDFCPFLLHFSSIIFLIDGGSTPRQVEVEIVVQKGNKAFLGGFKNNKTGSEYHHAITQTVEGKRKDWNQIAEGN